MEKHNLDNLLDSLNNAASPAEKADWHFEVAKHLSGYGRYAEAEEHLNLSIALDAQMNLSPCLKKHLALSECARGQARFHEAVMILKRLVDNSVNDFDTYYLGKSHLAISLSLLELGDYHEALEHVEQSRVIATKLDNAELIAQSNIKLGIILMELKDAPGGIKAFQDALEGFKTLNDSTGMAVALMNISNGYITIGDYNGARPFVEEAIRLNEEHGAARYLALNHHSLGSIYQGLGMFDNALVYLKMALEASISHNDKRLTAYAHISIGEVLNEVGFEKRDCERALKHLHQALETVRAYGSAADEYKVHKALAEHYESRNNWQQFAVHFKQYHELQLETISMDARNRASKLESALQLERKEKELELERSRNQEMEARYAKEMADQRLETFTRFALMTAHEVQNPLQFVNNFSELNVELINELEELTGDMELPEDFKAAMVDLKENSAKIALHGKRISAVVSQLLEKVNSSKKAA